MAVDYKDYYKILGVDTNAGQKDVQRAFRKLARKYHPDVNPGDTSAEEKFKEINEANEVLSDPEKRKQYDELRSYYQQYGHGPGAAGAGRAAGGRTQYRTMTEEDLNDLFGGASPFSDFFETYFGSGISGMGGRASSMGHGQRQAYAPATQDAESEVDVSLAEAYRGGKRVLELSEPDGSSRRLEVRVPAGVNDGARIRMSGQGFQGASGRGDLYLRVRVLPDKQFSREGTTLRTRVDVPLATSILGGEIMVPTPDGRRLALRIPAGTANGRAFRLRGQGMPVVSKPETHGDLYAEVNVILPAHLNDEQRRLFEAFAHSLEGTSQETGRREEGVHG